MFRPYRIPGYHKWHVLGGSGVIDTLDLDQTRLGVGVAAATLVAQVATPMK